MRAFAEPPGCPSPSIRCRELSNEGARQVEKLPVHESLCESLCGRFARFASESNVGNAFSRTNPKKFLHGELSPELRSQRRLACENSLSFASFRRRCSSRLTAEKSLFHRHFRSWTTRCARSAWCLYSNGAFVHARTRARTRTGRNRALCTLH